MDKKSRLWESGNDFWKVFSFCFHTCSISIIVHTLQKLWHLSKKKKTLKSCMIRYSGAFWKPSKVKKKKWSEVMNPEYLNTIWSQMPKSRIWLSPKFRGWSTRSLWLHCKQLISSSTTTKFSARPSTAESYVLYYNNMPCHTTLSATQFLLQTAFLWHLSLPAPVTCLPVAFPCFPSWKVTSMDTIWHYGCHSGSLDGPTESDTA